VEIADSIKDDRTPGIVFEDFNKLTEQLSTAYSILEQRIRELNDELQEAKREQEHQSCEKDRLTQRLSLLLAALPAGVIVIDGAGVIQEANPAVIELLDISLVGKLWRDIIATAIQTSSISGTEATLISGRIVSISTCPLGKDPGQIILLVDVTETRVLQTTLERYKRLSAMGEISAKIAHQIRTPLASALLYVSNMQNSSLAEPDRQRFVDKALARLRHLENVVDDMLSFTRQGVVTKRSSISLAVLINDLFQMMESHLEQASAQLCVKNIAVNTILLANRDALLSVMQNLINNAIEACGDGAVIEISCACHYQPQENPTVDISIKDNGPGIDEAIKGRLFEPFFTTRSQGTGLGLAVARAVVQSHGGNLWLESSLETGSHFIICLPVLSE